MKEALLIGVPVGWLASTLVLMVLNGMAGLEDVERGFLPGWWAQAAWIGSTISIITLCVIGAAAMLGTLEEGYK